MLYFRRITEAPAKTPKFERHVVPQKVRWMRRQAGWSQLEAADILGVTRETFSGWETGRNSIPPKRFYQLRQVLELVGVFVKDFKPDLFYDQNGFPYPTSKAQFERAYYSEEATAETEAAMEELLVKLEGEDYPARTWKRRYLEELGSAAYKHLPLKERKKAARKSADQFAIGRIDYFSELAIKHGW